MKFNKDDAISMSIFLMDKVKSFNELKVQLEGLNLINALGSEGLLQIADIYQSYVVKKYTNTELLNELKFWAEGGSYQKHLEGFNAISPKSLIAEAKARGWTVKELAGKVLISPDEVAPFTIPANVLIG